MKRFVQGEDRKQQMLLPNSLEDYVAEENPVRVIEVFIEELDLASLGFAGVSAGGDGDGRQYHPSALLKIYTLRLSQPASSPAGGWSGRLGATPS